MIDVEVSEPPLAESLAYQLRRDILRGKLAPGEPVKERDTAAELGVSRTPLREAIRILAREGLVILRPSRSPIVANPTIKEIEDAIAVLQVLEVYSGEMACLNATDTELGEIENIHLAIVEGFDELDPLDVFELDMALHRSIVRAAHNAALAETHDAYLSRLWRARYLAALRHRNKDRVLRQHGAILRGLMTRDKRLVSSQIKAHLQHLDAKIRRTFGDAET